MPPIWKPKDTKLLQHWCDTIFKEAEKDLTNWEGSFMNNIRIRLRAGFELTREQEDKLEQIYAEKTK